MRQALLLLYSFYRWTNQGTEGFMTKGPTTELRGLGLAPMVLTVIWVWVFRVWAEY